MRRRTVLALALGSEIMLACGSFGAGDALATVPSDAGAADASDSGSPTAEAGTDGGTEGAVDAGDCVTASYEDRFEGVNIAPFWNRTYAEDMRVTASAITGFGAGSLLAEVGGSNNTARWIERTLVRPCHLTVHLVMQIVSASDTEVDFVRLVSEDAPSSEVNIVHAQATNVFAVEHVRPNLPHDLTPLPATFALPTTVLYDVDFRTRKWTTTVTQSGSAPSKTTGELALPWKTATVRIGIPYTQNQPAPWKVLFDDVRIVAGP